MCLDSIIFPPLLNLISYSLMNRSNYFQSNNLINVSLISYPLFISIILDPIIFLSPSEWKMAKDAPNHIPHNMIG